MTWRIGYKELKYFCANESGQDLIEYGLVAALIGLGAIAALKNVTLSVGTVFSTAGTTMQGAV